LPEVYRSACNRKRLIAAGSIEKFHDFAAQKLSLTTGRNGSKLPPVSKASP
jgi:hypothetical protein